MSRTRPAAVLLATVALLVPAGEACAAGSKLTPTPPVPLPRQEAVTPPPAPPVATPLPRASALPRTGIDLPLEALVSGLLLVGGACIRVFGSPRPTSGRRT